uniref:Uncharacterized protein n=1 Tax=uncultured Alphaproteobacteria bacterium TaxID=91750 RepID=A0A1B0Z2E8_9PROT|nr:hypothetical protein [uncultured Alphaproteobacteria bacterium]ANO58371.1 hypothetical protein [uncultured Alphaproteobacteria bacterium]
MTNKKQKTENLNWLKSTHSEYDIHTKKIWFNRMDQKNETKEQSEQKQLYKEYNDLFDITEPSDIEKVKKLDKLQDRINKGLEIERLQ